MELANGPSLLVPSQLIAARPEPYDRGEDATDSDQGLPLFVPSELAPEQSEPTISRRRKWSSRLAGALKRFLVGCWGAITILVGLAILSTIPVLNLLSLGYLLDASGRVARARRISAGLVGLRPAAFVGTVVFAGWLLRWPVVFVSDFWYASYLIDPASTSTRLWSAGWFVLVGGLVALVAALIVAAAVFRPLAIAQARDNLWMLVTQWLPHYFWLGLRGFAGSMLWLVVPVSVLAAGSYVRPGAGVALSLLGGALLAPVVMLLPFLQTHFAAENRFAALFEVRFVRRLFTHAPLAFWLGLLSTLLFALPLYLLMIEALPREVTWLPSIAFVLFLFPARLVCGWAYGRATRRQSPRMKLSQWLARLGMLPLALTYAFFMWLSQYLLWHGVFSLYHQHAFLVPVPFFSG